METKWIFNIVLFLAMSVFTVTASSLLANNVPSYHVQLVDHHGGHGHGHGYHHGHHGCGWNNHHHHSWGDED